MRNLVVNVLSAPSYSSTNGTQIDANQLVSASFQAVFGDTTAAGTFKLQASNDNPSGVVPFTATNWTDIPTQSASITSGTTAILTIANMCYRWIRAVYTDTAAGVQTVVVHADVAGSLNSKYFLLNSGANAHLYYVWFNVNGAGVDPAVAGRTGIEVDLATGASAAAVGTAMATAIAAVGSSAVFSTSGTTTVTITNLVTGPFVPASNGTATPAFTFAVTGGGTTTINVSMNALSI